MSTLTGKMLGKKIINHARIEHTARVSQDTISAVVSKALIDQNISHDEDAAVLRQADQYRQQNISNTKLRNTKMLTRQKTSKSTPKFARMSTSCWLEDHDRMYRL